MGRTVETGIVLTGKDQSASAVLSKTAAEASKLEKQVSNIGKGAAQASPSLAKFAGGLGLYGGAAFVGMRALQDAMRGVIEHVASLAPDLAELQGEVSNLDSALVGIAKNAKDGADTFTILVAAAVDYFSTAAAESERFRLQLEKKQATQQSYLDSVLRSAQRESEVERQAAAEQAELHRKVADLKQVHEQEDKERHEAWKNREAEAARIRERSVAETIRRMEAKERYEADLLAARTANQNYIYDLERRVSEGLTDIKQRNLERLAQIEESQVGSLSVIGMEGIDVARTMGSAFGDAFAGIVMGTKTAEEGFRSLAETGLSTVLNVVEHAIMAYAAESAAGAFASQASIPIIGPILGAVAATSALGFVRGFLSKFEDGGIVRGGIKGMDSVPIMAQDGERVLTVQQTRSFERLVDSLAHGRSMPAAGAAAPPQIVVHVNSTVPSNRAQLNRAIRDSVLPAMRDLKRRSYRM